MRPLTASDAAAMVRGVRIRTRLSRTDVGFESCRCAGPADACRTGDGQPGVFAASSGQGVGKVSEPPTVAWSGSLQRELRNSGASGSASKGMRPDTAGLPDSLQKTSWRRSPDELGSRAWPRLRQRCLPAVDRSIASLYVS